MMTLEEFTKLAESYGSDIARWPEKLRKDAFALTGSDTKAVDVLRRERMLDEELVQHAPSLPDATFAAHILIVPERTKQDARVNDIPLLFIYLRPVWARALMLLVCGVIGYAAGMVPVTTSQETAQATQTSTDPISVESVILGPTRLNEVIL